jgi:uncharacterized protein YozE (UPF0346 family)
MAIAGTRCIYCFKDLEPEDICFVTVDRTAAPMPDEVKLGFMRSFEPEISPEDMRVQTYQPIRQYERGSDEFRVDAETGYPTMWYEPKESTTLASTVRICRHCHMPVPMGLGNKPNLLIGFCGNSGSGKTVYLLSLIEDLRRVKNLAVQPDPVFYDDSNQNNAFADMQKTQYQTMYQDMYSGLNGSGIPQELVGCYKLPDATPPTERLTPLVLNCTYKGRKMMLTLFDMAGEGSKDPRYMASSAKYLENADGIIFLNNPDYFSGMPKEEDKWEQHQYDELIMQYINEKARIAFVLTKFDKLYQEYRNNEEFRKTMLAVSFKENSPHANGFDTSNALNMDAAMRKLYDWEMTEDSIVKQAQQEANLPKNRKGKGSYNTKSSSRPSFWDFLFRRGVRSEGNVDIRLTYRSMFFAASALGLEAEVYQREDVPGYESSFFARNKPAGFRNVDPVLWILNTEQDDTGHYMFDSKEQHWEDD